MKKINLGLLISGIVFILSVIGMVINNSNESKDWGGLGNIAISIFLTIIVLISMFSALLSLVFTKKNKEPEIPSRGYLIAKKFVLLLFIVMILFFLYKFLLLGFI